MYKAVIFDLDDTLVRTHDEYRYHLVGKTLRAFGVTTTNEHINRFWLEGTRDGIIEKYFDVNTQIFWETFNQHNIPSERQRYTVAYDDARIVKELKQNGLRIGIVTASPPNIAEMEVDLIGKDYFDVVISARNDHGYRPKPDPHALFECLRMLNVDKKEAIYVGNGAEDVVTAKAAGVLDVFLDRGEYEHPDAQPTVTIKTLFDLRKLLGLPEFTPAQPPSPAAQRDPVIR